MRGLANFVNSFKKKKGSTAALSRNHVIEVSESGLVSLMGGKWTSFHSQGEECVDRILDLHPGQFDKNLTHTEG